MIDVVCALMNFFMKISNLKNILYLYMSGTS